MKKFASLLLALMMIFALAACGETSEPDANTSTAPSENSGTEEAYVTITITADRASDEAQMLMVNSIVERIPAETNGRVQVELLAPGTMGSLGEMTEGVMYGTLDMAALPDSTSSPYLTRNLDFLNMPGLFDNYDDVEEILGADGWLGEYINEVMEESNMIRLGLCDNGFRTVGSVDKPCVELSDYAGVKIRVAENQINIFEFQELGALPVAISSSELLNALEGGTVDACDQSITNYVSNGIEGTVHYINLIYDRYSSSSLCMNKDKWAQLTAEDQEIVAKICSEAAQLQFEASRQIADEYIETYTANGTWEVSERSASVDAALEEIAVKVVEEFGDLWDPQVVELINEHL